MQDDKKKPFDVILFDGRYYAHVVYLAAFNTEFLELVDRRTSNIKTERQLMRQIRDLRNNATRDLVMRKTLERLTVAGEVVDPKEAVVVVARFGS